ncbi:MAG: cadherin-like beta sandwich domain-containing protein [Agathobacter sp.]|nr:cadherin-like beta sandwich domain-containing protein [Lachnospiraceae bacterium]MDY2620304.1 cadherin-like beta sandwich domain-containing protein [Agathobacter sp.]
MNSIKAQQETNRGNQRKHNRKITMRFLTNMMAIVLLFGCLLVPDIEAKADNLYIALSDTTVKIGDTITVSVTVPAGVSATVNLTYPTDLLTYSSASDTASANAGTVSMTIGSYGSSNKRSVGTVTFQAKSSGKATFSASAPIAGNQEGDRVSVTGASASVNVKNETGDDAENGDNANKSSDNSLSSLTLSAGKLSPAFKYNITNYTAEVENNVTSVVVSAKANNKNATVESVKGGEKLVVGSNKIQIVVKAENGVTATYVVNVTRKAAGDDDKQKDSEKDEQQDGDLSQQYYEINGQKLYPATSIPEEVVPQDFEQGTMKLWEKDYPYLYNDKIGSQICLLYLVDENKENGALYMVMDSAPYEAYPYVSFSSEFGYIVVVPDADETTLPAGYKAGTLDIEGKGSIGAYYYGKDKDVCLVYAVNNEGNYGWYLYDVNERTYMRYLGNSEADREEIQVPDTEAQSGDVQKLESQNRMIFWAFLIVVLFLLIVIVILVLSRRNRLEHPEEEDFEDFDDFDDEENAELETENEQHTQEEENAEDDSDTLETNSEDAVKEDEPDGWEDTKSIPNENLPEETETEEADSEESDDEEEWENEIPKKKPKKHHFFGRKKKSSAEEESGIEFIDL